MLKLEANLQKRCIIVIATSFWRSLLSRNGKLRDFFKKTELSYENLNGLNSIAEQALQESNNFHVPEKVLVRIQDAIRLVGEKVFLWTNHVVFDFGLELEHAENIYWTDYGTVDETKTFQLYWQNDPILLQSEFQHSVYSLACILGQEDFVSKNMEVMKNMLKDYCEPELWTRKNIDTHSVIKIWLCRYFNEDKKEKGLRLYRHLETDPNPDAKLIFMCATVGYLNAVKYFANNLKNDRDKHFFLIAKKVLKQLRRLRKRFTLKDNYVEIIIFLMSNMSVERRDQFQKKNLCDLFLVLVNVWPYQDLVLQLAEIEEEHENILISVLRFWDDYTHVNVPPEVTDVIHQTLQKVLPLASKEFKRKKILDKSWLFYHMILRSDYPTLKLLLNDPYIQACRDQIFTVGVDLCFSSNVKEGHFHSVHKFMEEFLHENEKKEFKSKFKNILKEIVEKENYKVADKLVDWLADSKEERLLLKKEINSLQILTSFYEEKNIRLSTVTKLLNWQFEGDEEQMKLVRFAFRKDEFIRKEFYKIWCGYCMSSVETSKTKCSEFMSLFFESSEIEKFKRDKIIENELFLEIFCSNLLLPKNFESVDELLKFCNVPLDKIKKLKLNIFDDIENWVSNLLFQKKMFPMLVAVINWVVEDEKHKKTVIRKIINSPAGAELCWKVFEYSDSYFYEELSILFNVWMPCGNIEEVMEYFSETKMKYLFQRLQENGFVSKDDLEEILAPRRRVEGVKVCKVCPDDNYDDINYDVEPAPFYESVNQRGYLYSGSDSDFDSSDDFSNAIPIPILNYGKNFRDFD